MSKLTSQYYFKRLIKCKSPTEYIKVMDMYRKFIASRMQYNMTEMTTACTTRDWNKAVEVMTSNFAQ